MNLTIEGLAVGCIVVGVLVVDVIDGISDGDMLGVMVGFIVVGVCDGICDGLLVGVMDGLSVAEIDGFEV